MEYEIMGWFDNKSQEQKEIEILEFKLKMAHDKKASAADKKKLEKMLEAKKPKKGFWDF